VPADPPHRREIDRGGTIRLAMPRSSASSASGSTRSARITATIIESDNISAILGSPLRVRMGMRMQRRLTAGESIVHISCGLSFHSAATR
jgi:hypothetical protein